MTDLQSSFLVSLLGELNVNAANVVIDTDNAATLAQHLSKSCKCHNSKKNSRVFTPVPSRWGTTAEPVLKPALPERQLSIELGNSNHSYQDDVDDYDYECDYDSSSCTSSSDSFALSYCSIRWGSTSPQAAPKCPERVVRVESMSSLNSTSHSETTNILSRT